MIKYAAHCMQIHPWTGFEEIVMYLLCLIPSWRSFSGSLIGALQIKRISQLNCSSNCNVVWIMQWRKLYMKNLWYTIGCSLIILPCAAVGFFPIQEGKNIKYQSGKYTMWHKEIFLKCFVLGCSLFRNFHWGEC